MATFNSFEEIDAWKKSRLITNQIYDVTKRDRFNHDFVLRDQMRRAAISVMSNIAEGFERSGKAEFIQFLSIAKGSAGELKSQLYIAGDQNYINSNELHDLQENVNEVIRMLEGLINYLKKSSYRGLKFKQPE